MMDTFNAALADLDEAGVEYEISGMLWMQGESDAYAVVDPAKDTGHYGTQGQLDLGRDFASAVVEVHSRRQ